MGINSGIQWTDNTFNPWVGCFKVSPGCKNCYAEELMTRKGRWANTWGPPETTERIRTSTANWAKPLQWDKQAQKYGKRTRVFCSSLADVFEDNPQLKSWRIDLFMLISDTPNLDWQILTKRPEFARTFFEQYPRFLLPNIWLGTSVENQEQADKRIPELSQINCEIAFVSYEPALGYINFIPAFTEHWIDWVIVGGESGRDARPFDLAWASQTIKQCKSMKIPVFVKQIGSCPVDSRGFGVPYPKDKKGGDILEWPIELQVREFPND